MSIAENRSLASAPFDRGWIRRQRRLGLPAVIPDAGYVGEHDETGLRSVLERAAALGPDVIVPLFLHVRWLHPDNLPCRVEAVTETGGPIASALERQDDPLGTKYAVYGLVALLPAPVPVVLLIARFPSRQNRVPRTGNLGPVLEVGDVTCFDLELWCAGMN
ncbi:hypothetical protein G3I59_44080 [Amycolatopsis rubida]|uniref:Uncharacterized protein n=1 Tax=Amycolatopsis rubida TaxID=112413 RepID=A0ABX0C3P7_9PSEU|nr:hypothetical protein [Amycolatopsis rubida]MYW97415.1 hypothetical protein [Amycolatopsis rubida]NEC62400.1 hypothetical protein [Amycolatopsis rubida]